MTAGAPAWTEANHRYLRGELERLRLLLRRRVLWLRRQWAQDAQSDPPGAHGFAIGNAMADRLLTLEDRRAEERFYATDPEALAIARALAEREGELARQRAALTEAGTPAALDVLAHLFDLSGFERDVLLLALAPDLDPSFTRLYGYVQDDATRRFATPHLALSLFARGEDDPPAAWRSFQLHGPLFRFHLVVPPAGGEPRDAGELPLAVPQRVLGYLLGDNRLDAQVVSLLRPVPPAPLPQRHAELVDRSAQWAAPLLAEGSWPRLQLVGPVGSGRQAMARALCGRLGLGLYTLDLARLVTAGPELPNLLERESVLLQFALHVDADDLAAAGTARLLESLLERLRAAMVVSGREPLAGNGPLPAVRVPQPTAEERSELWRQVLSALPHSLNGAVEAVVEQFDFGPSLIVRAAQQAQIRARVRGSGSGMVEDEDLWLACREQAAQGMDGQAQRIQPCHTWDDIVLPTDVRRQLQEIAGQVANRHLVYGTWGFGAKLSRGRGISALFAGPSGTGKTLAAEILAHHLDLDLYRIDLSSVVSKYIGETEKNLRRVFDAAEQSGAILFFDEADALFGKRTEVKDSHDRYANIEIDYLLQRMEEYRGLAILATNVKSHLDQAFLRRLRFLVDFPFPSAEHRRLIWQKMLPPGAPVEDLRFDLLARLEVSGGNIQNMVLNAAFQAASDGAPIGMGHLMQAARREYAKEEKLVTQSEFGAYYEEARP